MKSPPSMLSSIFQRKADRKMHFVTPSLSQKTFSDKLSLIKTCDAEHRLERSPRKTFMCDAVETNASSNKWILILLQAHPMSGESERNFRLVFVALSGNGHMDQRKLFPHSTTGMKSRFGQRKISIHWPHGIKHIIQTSAPLSSFICISAICLRIGMPGVSKLSGTCNDYASLPACHCFHFHGGIPTNHLQGCWPFKHSSIHLMYTCWVAFISIP